MGLFSDRCEACVGADGKALTGPALDQAKLDPKAKRCGGRVPRAARFCRACGAPAPGGWWKCAACEKWIGNDATFCPHCRAPQYPESRLDIAAGVWQQAPGVFAERFEVGDIRRLEKDGVQIQSGTAAIFLDAGAVKGVEGPGRHNFESLARKINWFGDPPQRSLILVHDGDLVLPMNVEDLHSAEDVPMGLYAEAVLHFDARNAKDFVANLFQQRRRLEVPELAGILAQEIRGGVRALCGKMKLDDLFRDPELRTRLEDELQRTLKETLGRYGLDLLRVVSAEVTGEAYDELRKRQGEVELTRRRAQFDQELIELASSSKMNELREQNRLEEYVAQMAQERGIQKEHYEQESRLLQQAGRHEIESKDLAHQLDLEAKKHSSLLAKKAAEVDAETAEVMKWLAVRKAKDEAARANKEADAKRREKMSLADRIQDEDDPLKRKMLMELQAMEMKKGMTPEQMLAFVADQSPTAASALQGLAAAQRDEIRRMLDEQKNLFGQSRERDERMLSKIVEMMARAAEHRPAGPTIVGH